MSYLSVLDQDGGLACAAHNEALIALGQCCVCDGGVGLDGRVGPLGLIAHLCAQGDNGAVAIRGQAEGDRTRQEAVSSRCLGLNQPVVGVEFKAGD